MLTRRRAQFIRDPCAVNSLTRMSHNRRTRRARSSDSGCSLLWGRSLASPGVGVLDGLHVLSVAKAMQPIKSRG